MPDVWEEAPLLDRFDPTDAAPTAPAESVSPSLLHLFGSDRWHVEFLDRTVAAVLAAAIT